MITAKQGKQIAILINSMIVAKARIEMAEAEKDLPKIWLWVDSEYEAATKLVNMGIPVIAYKQICEHLEIVKGQLAAQRAKEHAQEWPNTDCSYDGENEPQD